MIPGLLRANRGRLYAVCSYGRSGTSFLMRLLNALNVGVLGVLPFEDRATQVLFIHWLRTHLQQESAEDLASTTSGSETSAGVTYSSQILKGTRSFEERKQAYTKNLDEILKSGKNGIAEKFVGFELLRIIRTFDNNDVIRPIYLIRDPRAIFVSVKEFNAKRGFDSFNDTGDDLRLFNIICDYEESQLLEYKRSGGLLCCYEDLVTYQERALVHLASYVQAGSVSKDLVEEIKNDLLVAIAGARQHMTSSDPADSVQRWRTLADASYAPILRARPKTINALGYAI